MAAKIPRVPVREQDPQVRARNFEEVCLGYNAQEAMLEASRCLNCKNPRCVTTTERGIDQMFHLVHSERQEYRCDYCDEEAKL